MEKKDPSPITAAEWRLLLEEHPWLAEGFGDFFTEPDADAISLVGAFVLLKVRLRRLFQGDIPEGYCRDHRHDDSIMPGPTGS